MPPYDAAALSAALTRLLDDQALARRLGAAAQDRARSGFDQKQFLARLNWDLSRGP